MAKKIMIIAKQETFIIRGMETKLLTVGADSFYCSPKLADIEGKCKAADLFILYTDDEVEKYMDSLVFLNDLCAEKGKQVIVVGGKDEYDVVAKIIPEDAIYRFFNRPLVMENLLNDVEEYLAEEYQNTRKKSILIVDDDVTYMTMISDWLKDKYRVNMMNSGVNAITWLATNHADLILLDYEMPITTGPQVLEMIRSQVSTADIPVMFLTGKGDKESVLAVMALKPVGYLLKNIKREDLRENIAKFFATQI